MNEEFQDDLNKKLTVRLIDRAFEFRNSLEKALLTLSGGALALSVTFIFNIQQPPKEMCLFRISLGLFVLSIITTLLSFIAGAENAYAASKHYEARVNKEPEMLGEAKFWGRFSKGLLWVSMSFFISGLILLAVFGFQNLPQ